MWHSLHLKQVATSTPPQNPCGSFGLALNSPTNPLETILASSCHCPLVSLRQTAFTLDFASVRHSRIGVADSRDESQATSLQLRSRSDKIIPPLSNAPESSQRWSDLMPLLTWHLWLARPEEPRCSSALATCLNHSLSRSSCQCLCIRFSGDWHSGP